MSKYRTDKNGFTVEQGEDWNDEKSDLAMSYLIKKDRVFSKNYKPTPIEKRILEYSNIDKAPSTIAEYHKQKQDKKVVKPIVKKILKPETLNLNFEPLPDLTVQRTAEDIEAEKRFRQLEAEIKQEKINRNTKGLMSFAPGVINDN